MAYAPADRPIYDADSHIMELPNFLKAYADPAIRDEIPEVSYSASIVTDEEVAVIMEQGGRHSEAHVAKQIALGDKLIESSKEIQALGAFNASDRTTAMDLLGFQKQLVFATHSLAAPFHPSSKKTPEWRYGAARAHNRHMLDFCAGDKRLMGVAAVPLDNPEWAIKEVEWVIEQGLEAVWIPHRVIHRVILTSRDSGRASLKPVYRLYCMSAVRRCRSTSPGRTMVGHLPRTGSAAVRMCAPRTPWYCTRLLRCLSV